MQAKQTLAKWKNEGGCKTYDDLAKALSVKLGTLDTWKNRAKILAKYILFWEEKYVQNENI